MTRTGIEIGGRLKPPPSPKVVPDALIGCVVQIALGGSDKTGPLGLLPPLEVTRWASEKLHYATMEDSMPGICFVGIPLAEFVNPVRVDPHVLRATGIRFKSRMPLFQPHFLRDPEFLHYFERSEDDVVPVDVYATDSGHRLDEEFIADEYNFSYVGEGVLQLFEPEKGFQKPWPRHFPWQNELNAVEAWLLSHCDRRHTCKEVKHGRGT